MKRTREKARETRNGIYDAALVVFSQKGFSATTLEDIAKEAGITRGAIYWNFKNKQDLYVQLLREYFIHKIQDSLSYEERKDASVLENLETYIRSYFQLLFHDEQFRQFIEMMRYKTEVKSEIIEVLQVQQEIDLILKTAIGRIVQSGIEKNEMRKDLSVEIISVFIVSMMNGIEDTWLINPSEFPLEEKLNDMITLLLFGVAKGNASIE